MLVGPQTSLIVAGQLEAARGGLLRAHVNRAIVEPAERRFPSTRS